MNCCLKTEWFYKMNDGENEMSNYCVSAKNGPTKKD